MRLEKINKDEMLNIEGRTCDTFDEQEDSREERSFTCLWWKSSEKKNYNN